MLITFICCVAGTMRLKLSISRLANCTILHVLIGHFLVGTAAEANGCFHGNCSTAIFIEPWLICKWG